MPWSKKRAIGSCSTELASSDALTVTSAEFARLHADARAFGETLGVAVTLRMVLAEQSPASGARIRLRVFRVVPGEAPREYPAAHGYVPNMKNLKERIYADIKTAAEALGAVCKP
jgi:hypothetical protein